MSTHMGARAKKQNKKQKLTCEGRSKKNSHMRAGAGRRTLDGEDISAGLVNKEDLLLLLIVIVTVANITAMMHYSLKRDALKIFG